MKIVLIRKGAADLVAYSNGLETVLQVEGACADDSAGPVARCVPLKHHELMKVAEVLLSLACTTEAVYKNAESVYTGGEITHATE